VQKKNKKQKAKTDAEKGRDWRPSARQIAIAELLLNPEDRRTKKDKIASIGLPERTFYKWMKDPRFIDYLNSRIEEYTNTELYEVWKALIMQCKRGNIQAIKLFFEMKEMVPMDQFKRQHDEERLKLAREELAIKSKTGSLIEEAIKNSQQQTKRLADMIDNPHPNRGQGDIE